MRKTLIMAALFATVSGFAQNTQCKGITKANAQCKIILKTGTELCWRHDPNYVKKVVKASTVCTGTTKAGNNCSLRTRDVSGICHHHRIKKD
jgi:hypothetical protein